MQLWKKIALALAVMMLFIATAVVTYSFVIYQRVTVTSNRPIDPSASPSPTPDVNQPFSILLLGYGGGGHSGGKLTDTIMIAHIVPKDEHIYLISLPRDLWVPLEAREGEMTHMKINAAYAIGSDDKNYRYKPVQYTGEAGGGEMAKDAVKTVLGLPIEYFAAVSFNGFEKSINALNGVTVTVERSFDDYLYPIEGKEDDPCGKTEEELAAVATMSASEAEKQFPCRYEHLHFDRGPTLMTGETALKYVRSRHSAQDGGDFNRAARQRALLLGVKKRVLDLNFLPKAIPFITTLSQDFRTDITLEQMNKWIERKDEFSEYEIVSVALTDKNILKNSRSADGQFIVIPQAGLDEWQSVHEWLKGQLSPNASQAAEASPAVSTRPAAQPAN
jgi:anionic cell wall polymer biosynthesis LytR-Cps2A-Psr (LCP) family protein